ncbi:hypothetical protein LCGC14_3040440 [marine sediment metagenome]|uniref:Uncharacterized protein n=1 Tax=marine sediment metagenome TaxID=412755 RepID=A0A0F8YXR5_9ZZZZ
MSDSDSSNNIRPFPIDLHTVDILLVTKDAIEVPGLAGVMPVFINRGLAYLYLSKLPEPERFSVQKLEVVS